MCITRLPLRESPAAPRSHCRNCQRQLRWFENVPVASWLALRGLCRTCGSPIGWRYPLVEAALAAMWAACAVHFGATELGLRGAVLCFLLLGLCLTDAETFLLPDMLTLPGLAAGLLLSGLATPRSLDGLEAALTGAAIGAAVLLAIAGVYYALRRQQGMGMGDVKLLAMIGAFLGPMEVGLVFFLGTILTAAAAIVWLLLRAVAGSKSTPDQAEQEGDNAPPPWHQQPMPYGTFLAAAGIFALFWGHHVLKWYMGIGH